MLIYTNVIYAQITIKSTFFFIDLALGNEAELINIIIYGVLLVITIILLLLEVLKKQIPLIKSIGLLLICFLNIEILIHELNQINSLMLHTFIVILIKQFEDASKWQKLVKHSIMLYLLIRILIQFYNQFQLTQLLTQISWQPLNHIMLQNFVKKQQQLPNSPNFKDVSDLEDQSSAMRYSSILNNIKQTKTFEMKNPFFEEIKSPVQNNPAIIQMIHQQSQLIEGEQQTYSPQQSLPILQKSTSNLDIQQIWNLLPFGIALMNSQCELQTYNQKLLHYLKISEQDRILINLDTLLESAEPCESKSICKVSSHTSNRHSKRLLSRRQLSLISRYHNDQQNSINQEGGTNTNINGNFTYVVNTTNQIKDIKDEVLTTRTRYRNLDLLIKKFAQKSHSINNNQDNSFQSTGQSIQVLKLIQEIENKKYYFRIKVYAIDVTENKINYLFFIENITNKEELRQLNIRYKFQQVLLNSLCHELRTPMNSTLSQLNALSSLITPQIREQNLIPAIISAKKLMFQLNDILDYAQIDCKNFHLNKSQFDINEIFDILKELFEQECKEKNLELTLQCINNYTIFSDKDRIIRILANLVDNSIKFTNQGGYIDVTITQFNQYLLFVVEDNGVGMSEKTLNKIKSTKDMQMQDQFHSNQTKLGLGLRISQQIAKFLCVDKELIFESKENAFTKISFKIENSQKLVIQQQFPSFQGIKCGISCDCVQILNVDDVQFNHSAITALLAQHKVKMDSAYNGTQAVQMIKDKQKQPCCKTYRLIFMDIEMPIKNGYQASTDITNFLESENLNDQCAIVMCSAYNGFENSQKAIACGIKEMLPKPIEQKALKHLLDKYLY